MKTDNTHQRQRGKGPSSYWMQEPEQVFHALSLSSGDRILDLGCGAGDYTLEAARIVGSSGHVFAVDCWSSITEALEKAASARQITNIEPLLLDITKSPLPSRVQKIDLCLVFMALYIFGLQNHWPSVCEKIIRVLKPAGRLAILECKKEETSFGPTAELRLTPEEVEAELARAGFTKTGYTELKYTYLLQFKKN